MPSKACRVLVLVLDDGGGMSHYAENLASGLQANCYVALHKIHVNDAINSNALWGRLLDKVRVLRQLRRYYNPYRMRRIACALTANHQPTVVHVTSAVPCMYALVSEFRRRGAQVIYTVHDPEPHDEKRTTWGKLHGRVVHKQLLPRALKLLNAIHVHSALHAKKLRQLYETVDIKKLYVVQHGGGVTHEVEAGSITPPELNSIADSRRCILFFGRIEPYKGLHILFLAVERLISEYPDMVLLVAGNGNIPAIPERIRPNVTLINRFIRDTEIKAIISKAAFIVLPYLEATQTGVIPLAATFALPAVATRVGALADLVVDSVTGILIAPDDAEGLANAIEKMINSPEQTQLMGQAAKNHMNINYAWSIVSRLHYEQYEHLLARNGEYQ